MKVPEWITLAVAALAAFGECLHARRCARVARLAFGPLATARAWTQCAPPLRVIAVALLAWGLIHLFLLAPKVARPALIPEGGFRHLIIALDVSPSMKLKDAGPARDQTRAARASEVAMSVLERIALDQLRVSVVAFYTSAKPVVVDTYDIEVVKNVLNDLPLDMAFNVGKTSLIAGVKESVALARSWQPGSTTLLIISDGDAVPDTGLPALPPSISQVVIMGVGNARAGQNIDGHLSRQDAPTLRQLATRLRGAYHDINEKHLPSAQLEALSKTLPMRDEAGKSRREYALASVAIGAVMLTALPVLLALAGTSWKAGVRTRGNSLFFRKSSGVVRKEVAS